MDWRGDWNVHIGWRGDPNVITYTGVYTRAEEPRGSSGDYDKLKANESWKDAAKSGGYIRTSLLG
jgi:hypothetical protein